MKKKSGDEKVLIVKGIAGLGNRILALLSAILYGRLTNRRLIVDWRDCFYANDRANAFPLLFECGNLEPAPATFKYDSINPAKWVGRLDKVIFDLLSKDLGLANYDDPKSWREHTVDLRRIDHPEDALVMWSFTDEIDSIRVHFKGEFSDLKRASTRDILRGLYRENLKVSPVVLELARAFKEERFAGKVVGVHARFSDKKSRLERIRNEIDKLLKREPGLIVFLSTDSLAVLSEFERAYPKVISTPKWYAPGGRPLHYNPECPDLDEAALAALADMLLLAESDFLVVDESSAFSRVAAIMTDIPNERIVNVQRGRWLSPRARRALWLVNLRLKELVGLR